MRCAGIAQAALYAGWVGGEMSKSSRRRTRGEGDRREAVVEGKCGVSGGSEF